MAKPIRATPELWGDAAKRFVKLMEKREKSKITKKELELAKAIDEFSLSAD